jgi:hypothetical protein
VATHVLGALAHIHEAGMVHRDIKPHNIMLSTDRRTVVMDFGIARPAATDTTVTAIGTPGYAAPEQVGGRTIDGRADLYALGKVLFECLLGARRHADDWARVPVPLRDLLDSMTHPDPDQRPRSASECLRRLAERPAPPPPRVGRPLRRWGWDPWTLLARFFVVLALVAVACGSGWLGARITHWHFTVTPPFGPAPPMGVRWVVYGISLVAFLLLLAWAAIILEDSLAATLRPDFAPAYLAGAAGVGALGGDAYALAALRHAPSWLVWISPGFGLAVVGLLALVFIAFDRAYL